MLSSLDGRRGHNQALNLHAAGFAEPLFEHLGAEEICSVDASDFEGATYAHDFNTPLPPSLSGRFSAVIDGGSLEHIFDFPTAVKNSMQMVDADGHLLCISPVNNAPGHGFYQFSPELFFRVLSPENGFVVERMLLAEVRPRAKWYRVVDPAVVGRRIEFTTRHQAYLYVQARRLRDRPVLAQPPVQSDYELRWKRQRTGDTPGSGRVSPDTSGPAAPKSHPVGTFLETLRTSARHNKTVYVPVRRLRRAVADWRRFRQPLEPDLFQPLGRRLSDQSLR
jgi:hypothetical protein